MLERTLSRRIESLQKDFKIIFISGSRQVGKTTILKALKEEGRSYVTLDEQVDRELAQNDSNSFFLLHPVPCLIDEVQRAEELFVPMKKIVDEREKTNQIWITGSQKPLLSKRVGDTLAGRVVELNMYPLSQAEKQKDPYRKSFYPSFGTQEKSFWTYEKTLENIVNGGYPALQNISPENFDIWFSSYINTYLLGDIRSEMHDMDSLTFTRILKILATRTATALNCSAIAEESGLSLRKVNQIIDLLQSCSLIMLLPAYSGNAIKALVKTPRLHFVDSGLCCHLLGIRSVSGLLRHPLRGAVFESYVVSEVIRNARNNGDESEFYFYREENHGEKEGPAEIDLIKENNGILYPMEIKMSATPTVSMAKHFKRLIGNSIGMGTIICLNEIKTILSHDILVMPISLI